MNLPRVLQLTARADYGGGPEHIWQLLKHSHQDYEFFVACPDDKPYWNRYDDLLTSHNLLVLPHRLFRVKALLQLILFIRKHNIQLIHTHGKGAGLYGRLAGVLTGVPGVHTPHGIHLGCYGKVKTFLYKAYENISSHKVRHIFFVSKSEQEQARSLDLWQKKPYSIVNNGVENTHKACRSQWREEIRKKLAIPDHHFIIASLTRFDFQKNMQEAYQIAKDCPQCLFLWIGDGEDRETLQQQALQESVKNIYFCGYTDTPRKFLAASDMYLSTSRWEGLPLGLLEAMSIGLPVVASNVIGNQDVVSHGKTGFCYPLGDIETARSYLRRIMENESLYQQLSTQAIRIQRESFSVTRMAESIYNQYQQIITK